MAVSTKDIQALRQSTGAGMMDCKKALEATDGDIEAAKVWLREKGLAASANREDRDNAQGVVSLLVDGRLNGFFKDVALLDQPYAKDDKQSVSQVLGGATIVKFAQVEIG